MMADFVGGRGACSCACKSCHTGEGGNRHRRDLGSDRALHPGIDGDICPTSSTACEIHPVCSRTKINGPQIDTRLIRTGILIDLPIDIAHEKTGLDVKSGAGRCQVIVFRIKTGSGCGLGNFAPTHIICRIDGEERRRIVLPQQHHAVRFDGQNRAIFPVRALTIREVPPDQFSIPEAQNIIRVHGTCRGTHPLEIPRIATGAELDICALRNTDRAGAWGGHDIAAQHHIISDIDPDDLASLERLQVRLIGHESCIDGDSIHAGVTVIALLSIDVEEHDIERIGGLGATQGRRINEGCRRGVDHEDPEPLQPAKISAGPEVFRNAFEIRARSREIGNIGSNIAQIGAARGQEGRGDLNVIPGFQIECGVQIGLHTLLAFPDRLSGDETTLDKTQGVVGVGADRSAADVLEETEIPCLCAGLRIEHVAVIGDRGGGAAQFDIGAEEDRVICDLGGDHIPVSLCRQAGIDDRPVERRRRRLRIDRLSGVGIQNDFRRGHEAAEERFVDRNRTGTVIDEVRGA